MRDAHGTPPLFRYSNMKPDDPYLLDTVLRGCDVLKAFRSEGEALRLKDVVERTGLHKSVVFRLVHTLEQGGILQRDTDRRYRAAVKWLGRSRYKFGYAAQSEDSPFSDAVTESLCHAASREGIELVILNNRYSAKCALANAEQLIRERVDLAIEFQTFERVAPMIAARFHEAGIPLIAVEIPHPGATYYGANNYQVGLCAGRALGRWARQHWEGAVHEVLLLELGVAGPVPQLRLNGMETGIREVVPGLPRDCFVHLDSKGDFSCALDVVRRRLRHTPRRKTLIGGINDPSVLGALRAFEEAGRSFDCAGIGQGAISEARAEMRAANTRLIASVAFFPERYGEALVRLAIDILGKRPVPPAVYADHHLVTPANLSQLYPVHLEVADAGDLLLRRGLR